MASLKVKEHLNNEEIEGKEALIDAFLKQTSSGDKGADEKPHDFEIDPYPSLHGSTSF